MKKRPKALSRQSSDPIEAVDRNEREDMTTPISNGDSSKIRSVNCAVGPPIIAYPKSNEAYFSGKVFSAGEAREYLSGRHGKQAINGNSLDGNVEMGSVALCKEEQTEGMDDNVLQRLGDKKAAAEPPGPTASDCEDSHPKEYELVPSEMVELDTEALVTTMLDAPTSELASDESSIMDTEQSFEIEERVDETCKSTCPDEISDSFLLRLQLLILVLTKRYLSKMRVTTMRIR
ncbi:hypothetical protein Ancab_036859 [Ancistrocladus abbreviatus]